MLWGIGRCLWSLGGLPDVLVWDREGCLHAGGGRPSERYTAFRPDEFPFRDRSKRRDPTEGGHSRDESTRRAARRDQAPAQDLDRAPRFYRDRLGLEPVEEREGGLRYVCGTTEFHIFASSGAASGRSTQLGFEVQDIDQAVADLRARGLEFESFDLGDLEVTNQIVVVPGNYPSKGTGERGAFFFDSEGNLLALGQATR